MSKPFAFSSSTAPFAANRTSAALRAAANRAGMPTIETSEHDRHTRIHQYSTEPAAIVRS